MLNSRAVVASLTIAAGLYAAPPATKTPTKPAAAPKTAQATAPAPAPAPPAQGQAPAVNSITQAAVKAGVLASAGRINQVMTYLTGTSQCGAFLFLPKTQPDQSLFSASLEIQNPNATPIYASASFAPLPDGRSAAVYDAIQYVQQSCEFVEKNIFKNLKRTGILRRDVIALDGGDVKIFLMPAGSGCIVIKKEVVQ